MSGDHKVTRRTRRGIAPLEMVMSLPFLVGVVAMIFSLGWAALYRSMACVEARHEVWKLRSDPERSTPALERQSHTRTTPLGIENLNPLAGRVYGEVEHEITLYRGFGQVTVLGRAAVLANNWDHKFIDGDFDGDTLHKGILYRMALGIGLGSVSGLGDNISNLMNGNLPEQSAAADAQKHIDAAQGQQDHFKKQHEKKLQELQNKYDDAKAAWEKLVRERPDLIREIEEKRLAMIGIQREIEAHKKAMKEAEDRLENVR